jgi:hypothetical protein
LGVVSFSVFNLSYGGIQTMCSKRLGIAAAVIVGLGATGIGLAAFQAPGDAQGPPATSPRRDAARLPPAAAVMYKYVKLRAPNELKWQTIPWLIDLLEGIRVAKAEHRPLLLFMSGDDPLERC